LLLLGLGVTALARRLHRRLAFPKIMQAIVASGGRSPAETRSTLTHDAGSAIGRLPAGTARRAGGFLVDALLQSLLAAAVVVAVMVAIPIDDYMLERGGERVTIPAGESVTLRDVTVPQPVTRAGARWHLLTRATAEWTHDGQTSTYAIAPRFEPAGAATTVVFGMFSVTGTLSEAEPAAPTLTLTGPAQIPFDFLDAASESTALEPGDVVTLPASRPDAWTMAEPDEDLTAPSVAFVTWLAFSWIYSVLPIVFGRHATPGMWVAGLVRTDLEGSRIGLWTATKVWFWRIVSWLPLCGLGFVVALFTRRRQTFHDWMAGSLVLRRRKEAGPVASAAVESVQVAPV
jgi:uncharacterized RDD family membrane protein YckC